MSASPRSCRSRCSRSPPTSGDGGLGRLFTEGFQRDFPTPVIVGVVLTILLVVVADALLVALQYVLTP